ncbi:universal stress protein [Massilia sp. BSC265]|uniref:universal stress protein n=1 Tax=Massilia sp. BSC265 TaxID=1549812 RepID=UPI0004E89132|nr:universal stress protein [Massilia sp. BSC265]KFI07644.1 hypothetical protein JN27_08710 [Massilia sp. BSC265]
MKTLLVPCDGSENALRALMHAALKVQDSCVPVKVDLLHVLDPISFRAPDAVLSSEGLRRLHPREAERALQAARAMLGEAGIAFRESCRIGQPADEIADHVREHGHASIVMGTRGLGPVASLVLGSVASRVVGLVRVPVTLVK